MPNGPIDREGKAREQKTNKNFSPLAGNLSYHSFISLPDKTRRHNLENFQTVRGTILLLTLFKNGSLRQQTIQSLTKLVDGG